MWEWGQLSQRRLETRWRGQKGWLSSSMEENFMSHLTVLLRVERHTSAIIRRWTNHQTHHAMALWLLSGGLPALPTPQSLECWAPHDIIIVCWISFISYRTIVSYIRSLYYKLDIHLTSDPRSQQSTVYFTYWVPSFPLVIMSSPKQVRFSPTSNLLLIKSLSDDNTLKHQIWWTKDELDTFQLNMREYVDIIQSYDWKNFEGNLPAVDVILGVEKFITFQLMVR